MTTDAPARPRVAAGRARAGGGGRLPPHWPLSAMLLGFPLWWLLGLGVLVPMALAAVMAAQLWRRRNVQVSAGFGWWLLFLVWVVLGGLVLWADAPGAVPGGGLSRIVVYAYRIAWYVSVTAVFLWIVNARRRDLPDRLVMRLFAYMFVVTVAGGLAGVLWPEAEFQSPLEILLPQSLAGNSLISSIVHPSLADIQSFLGYEEARPKAPFAFANSWGSNLSLYLIFFVVAWCGRDGGWRRIAAPVVLVVAAVPIIFSLNRGLWASLIVGMALIVFLQAVRGRVLALAGLAGAAILGAALFATTPLNDLLQERLANGHSNDRRGGLLVQTFRSTLEGSPIAGFGSTRDVQGSFASIAGGSTPDCPACGVPPLGTQGHLWLLIFSQGLVGAALFLVFFGVCLSWSFRCRTVLETMATCALVFFALQIFIYDTLGMPLLTLMALMGLLWREQHPPGSRPPPPTFADTVGPIWHARRLVIVFVVVGSVVGVLLAHRSPSLSAARTSILLAPSPTYIATDILDQTSREPRQISIDTEAALVFSEATMSRLRDEPGILPSDELRRRLRVTAPPNSRVINLEVRAADPRVAERTVTSLTAAYLAERRTYLAERRQQVLAGLRDRLLQIERLGELPTEDGGRRPISQEDAINAAIDSIVLTTTGAGDVIRTDAATPVRRQLEVEVVSGAEIGLLVAVVLTGLGFGGSRSRSRGRATQAVPGRR